MRKIIISAVAMAALCFSVDAMAQNTVQKINTLTTQCDKTKKECKKAAKSCKSTVDAVTSATSQTKSCCKQTRKAAKAEVKESHQNRIEASQEVD